MKAQPMAVTMDRTARIRFTSEELQQTLLVLRERVESRAPTEHHLTESGIIAGVLSERNDR